METIEWFDSPATVLGEMARVASKRILLVQSDWQSLWFDSGDPETSREFTRLFAGPAPPDKPISTLLNDFVSAAGLRLTTHETHNIRGEMIAPDTYARHLLGLMRDWLCNQLGAVRARRFDNWHKDGSSRARRHFRLLTRQAPHRRQTLVLVLSVPDMRLHGVAVFTAMEDH